MCVESLVCLIFLSSLGLPLNLLTSCLSQLLPSVSARGQVNIYIYILMTGLWNGVLKEYQSCFLPTSSPGDYWAGGFHHNCRFLLFKTIVEQGNGTGEIQEWE